LIRQRNEAGRFINGSQGILFAARLAGNSATGTARAVDKLAPVPLRRRHCQHEPIRPFSGLEQTHFG
jgi:hypothetical protein